MGQIFRPGRYAVVPLDNCGLFSYLRWYVFDTALFVVCCALALIVMYDASGIRRAAGEQAKMINMIVEAWEEKDPVLKDEKLKELLGHTPLEVLGGAVLGVFVALVSGVFLGL